MQIYFSPEFFKEDSQVLNIVTQNNEPVGYLTFLMKDKKMYVFGVLENEGVTEDFKDLVKPYVQGLLKIDPEMDVYSYLTAGGKKLDVEFQGKKKG
ncbi:MULTISPECIES: hypothetical protein [Alteribacter]|uniref:Uncharacterized protein n=1 Tax=Alteribacter keqinensis TaxID=2483800 RepID=A0A3M7TXC7_9BACI|nr:MULTISPECIES: hypothetical protein [Alteribacter]MBM7096128.1 hypothetical protein [Alteribacter salitolerans]RNA69931.1 hypothetical protein EBO34_08370 [Alteribacter keqinensis]